MQCCRISRVNNQTENTFVMPNKASFSSMSVAQIKAFINDNASKFSKQDYILLSEYVNQDGRAGVKAAFKKYEQDKKNAAIEKARVEELYKFQEKIAAIPGCTILGLDEVGRGPLAGPLTVGGVILDDSNYIMGLNDSKQITPSKREEIAKEIKSTAKV